MVAQLLVRGSILQACHRVHMLVAPAQWLPLLGIRDRLAANLTGRMAASLVLPLAHWLLHRPHAVLLARAKPADVCADRYWGLMKIGRLTVLRRPSTCTEFPFWPAANSMLEQMCPPCRRQLGQSQRVVLLLWMGL